LDEANRLSQDNLTVLFDLCQSLELQLLVAAPEVARAEGATTYRLVRRTDEQGREEVVVSGRRALRDAQGAPIERPAERPPGSVAPPADTPPDVSFDPSTGQAALLLGDTESRDSET
jgi:chromosome partition protein MukB